MSDPFAVLVEGELPADSRECSVEGCTRPKRTNGLCGTHRRRERLYGSPDITLRPARYQSDERCLVTDCTRRPRARQLCAAHAHIALWIDHAELGYTWDELVHEAGTWQRVRERIDGSYRNLRPTGSEPDPDQPLVSLARACLAAGWPAELIVSQLPAIWRCWPACERERAAA